MKSKISSTIIFFLLFLVINQNSIFSQPSYKRYSKISFNNFFNIDLVSKKKVKITNISTTTLIAVISNNTVAESYKLKPQKSFILKRKGLSKDATIQMKFDQITFEKEKEELQKKFVNYTNNFSLVFKISEAMNLQFEDFFYGYGGWDYKKRKQKLYKEINTQTRSPISEVAWNIYKNQIEDLEKRYSYFIKMREASDGNGNDLKVIFSPKIIDLFLRYQEHY